MRLGVRNQLFEILDTIRDGLKYIKNTNFVNTKTVLNDIALTFGAIIDILQKNLSANRFQSYGQLFLDVNISQVANHILAEKQIGNTSLTEIEKFMDFVTHLQFTLRNEPEITLEILFLPYKLSMWDSLESIWRAANQDTRCNCYVVPLPYIERNSQGVGAELVWEGEKYPKNLPLIHYSQYDISLRKPDVIYIHNVYDGYNYVTSVPSNYYTDELKKHTDMLVYVPYFVAMDKLEEYFCNTPVLNNVNKIIVQSKKIKQIYDKFNDSNKVIALGSPKIDYLVSPSQIEMNIPKDWQKFMNNKKIFLYNTHLNHLINDGENAIAQIKSVFSYFRNRNDVLLLWRPHPLSKATLSSMNEKLLSNYLELVDDYRQSNIGIYDNTPDLYRAITISDAYFGDWSSLVTLFAITGKPTMIQSLEASMNLEDFLLKLTTFSTVLENDTMWFSSKNSNGIFSLDLKTLEVDFIDKFPDEFFPFNLYNVVEKIDSKLIFTPISGKGITMYDLKTKKFESYSLDIPNEYKDVNVKFCSSIRYKNYVVLLAAEVHGILFFNLDTGEQKFIDCWKEEIKKYKWCKEEVTCFFDYCLIGDTIFLPYRFGNAVLELNLNDLSFKVHEIKVKNYTCATLTFDGNYFWIAPGYKGKSIIRWNKNTNEVKEYGKISTSTYQNNAFLSSVYSNGSVWFFPQFAEIPIKINITTREIVPILDLESSVPYDDVKYPFVNLLDENTILVLSAADEQLLYINTKTNAIQRGQLVLPKNWFELKKQAYFQHTLFHQALEKTPNLKHIDYNNLDLVVELFIKDVYKNSDKYSEPYRFILSGYNSFLLPAFIDFVVKNHQTINYTQVEAFKNLFINSDGKCGQAIHDYIISQLV